MPGSRSRKSAPRGRCTLLSVACVSWVLAACEPERSDLREWRPSDHDQPAAASSTQALPASRSTGKDTGMHGIDEVVLAAWKQNCVRCHGVIGRGDGPQGAMFGATDLTRADWQVSVSDESIADTIRTGRGSMPGFSNLPEPTVKGLIRLIRLLNAGASDKSPPQNNTAPAPGNTGAGRQE